MTTILERHYPEEVVSAILSHHLRISPDDGELYDNARQCVLNAFDEAEAYTNRLIVDTLATFGFREIGDGVVEMPSSPIKEVIEVRYLGTDDVWHTLPESAYSVESTQHRAVLELFTVPALSATRKGTRFEVSVRCGYDAEGEHALPGSIRQAVMLIAGTFVEYTADNVVGTVSELPMSARYLLNHFRIYPYGS